jgi:hypothetical protein
LRAQTSLGRSRDDEQSLSEEYRPDPDRSAGQTCAGTAILASGFFFAASAIPRLKFDMAIKTKDPVLIRGNLATGGAIVDLNDRD